MSPPSARIVCAGLVAGLVALLAIEFAHEPEATVQFPRGFFARAIAAHNSDQIDLCFAQRANANDVDESGHTPLLTAIAQEDSALVKRLLENGARADVADPDGTTPLMIAATRGETELTQLLIARGANADVVDHSGRTALHHALAASQPQTARLLLPAMTRFEFPPSEDRDLLNLAFASDDAEVAQALLQRLPPSADWTPQTRRALQHALKAKHKDEIRMLLAKHRAPPLYDGTNVPLLAQLIAQDDVATVRLLLECGADPNTVLPKPCDKKFAEALSSKLLRNYLEEDSGITVLMEAAALGKADSVRALLAAGADRNRGTGHDKWIALYFGARSKNWQTLQTLLGGGPSPDEMHVEISLAKQNAALFKHGVSIFTTQISTGRASKPTPVGDFVITDKERDHRSTIYKCPMPYFMRLSCLDFGMHEGVVPRYPASHGCIRLPGDAARKLFSEIPVGTVVTIN